MIIHPFWLEWEVNGVLGGAKCEIEKTWWVMSYPENHVHGWQIRSASLWHSCSLLLSFLCAVQRNQFCGGFLLILYREKQMLICLFITSSSICPFFFITEVQNDGIKRHRQCVRGRETEPNNILPRVALWWPHNLIISNNCHVLGGCILMVALSPGQRQGLLCLPGYFLSCSSAITYLTQKVWK